MIGPLSLGLALFGAGVNAFPRIFLDQLNDPTLAARAVAMPAAAASAAASPAAVPPQGAGALPLVPPAFDPEAQYVSTTGKYAWVAPVAGDQRGECPGLNAMANHGYLPHNGIGTINDFASACQTVYGMSPDLAAFLSLYGAIVDGTLTTWSVGGSPHIGIGGAHGNYESDSSLAYGDIDQYGNFDEFVYSQFMGLYNLQPDAATANYNLDVMRHYRKTRFDQSVANNPKFFYNVFSGTIVTQAGFTFAYRFFGNKSAEYPEGILNKNVLRHFYGAWFGTEEKPVHKFGYERIPDNWYKRNILDEYSLAYLETDILYFTEVEPRVPLPGCNEGKGDTYNGIDLGILTSGAYTEDDVNKQPLCFGLQYTKTFLPQLTGLVDDLLQPLTSSIDKLVGQLGGCSAIEKLNTTGLSLCPGFALFGGPTGPIAEGAKPN